MKKYDPEKEMKTKMEKKMDAFKSGPKAYLTTVSLNQHFCLVVGTKFVCILHANGNCCIQLTSNHQGRGSES